MHEIMTKDRVFPPLSIGERGFGIAAFCFEPGGPAGKKMQDLPTDPAPSAVPHGRKS